MPTWIDHLAVVVLAVLFPIRAATFGYRRLQLAAPADVPRMRLALYRQAIVVQWALTLGVLAIWMGKHRSWEALGLVPRVTPWLPWIAAAFTALAFLQWKQRARALGSDEGLARVRKRLAHVERMLPHTRFELRWFERLSITAGICEELLYRGFMLWYLFAFLGTVPAVLLAGAVFGAGHAYQGWKGALGTGVLGVVFGAVYLLCGSLYLPMVLHALTDLYAGHLAQPALAGQVETASPAQSA